MPNSHVGHPERWSPHILQPARTSLSPLGTPLSRWPGFTRLSACWVQCSDRSRRSSSDVVRNIWDIYIQELSFVPWEVRERLRTACNTNDVDASWQIWSTRLRRVLFAPTTLLGGPALSGPSRIHRGGQLSLRTRRLVSRNKDRICRTGHADEFDVTNSGFFINPSLAPVLPFRRRFTSVCTRH